MFARTLTALLLCASPALASPPAAPMPRAALTPQHPLWYDPAECTPHQLELNRQLTVDSLNCTLYRVPPARSFPGETRTGQFIVSCVNPDPREEAPTPFSFIDWTDLLLGAPPKAPCRSARDTLDGVIQRVYGEEFARAAKSRRLRDEFVALHKCAAAAPPAEVPLVCPPCPLPKIEVNPLLGTWFREVPGCVACATFTHDELKLTFAESDGTKHTATAQYTVTKDGLVFGAITGTTGPASLVDVPFSFRFRVTSDGVMVSAFKSEPMGDTSRFCGLFKSAKDGKVPAPVATKPAFTNPFGASPLNAPSAPMQWKEPVRPASLETTPAVLPPVLDGPPPMPPARPNASAPPDASKQFADEAFGALLQQSGVLPKPKADPETMTPPLPRYLDHYPQYIGPDPAFPIPRELAAMEAAPAKKVAHVGAWHRETGPMTCVVKIDAEYVTVTATVSAEENGKKVKRSVVITGDYHLARDGTTLVGLVTGLDVPNAGATGKDARALDGLYEVAKLQKGFVGQPFALTVRAYGDVLVIGDVRMGEHGFGEMAAMLAGRYTSGEPKAAEPKVLPRATGATPRFIPLAQTYSADPDVRTQQLHSQSDDLRQIQTEWWRFWFNDAPSKLTPERVHGGIY